MPDMNKFLTQDSRVRWSPQRLRRHYEITFLLLSNGVLLKYMAQYDNLHRGRDSYQENG